MEYRNSLSLIALSAFILLTASCSSAAKTTENRPIPTGVSIETSQPVVAKPTTTNSNDPTQPVDSDEDPSTSSVASGPANDGESNNELALSPSLSLDPVIVSTNSFSEIISAHPGGGVVVIPDGIYTATDLKNFNPDHTLILVAENPNRVVVKRESNQLGKTVFRISDSSNITFAGIKFEAIVTQVDSSEDIEFRYTHHSYPIQSHPDPTTTYCGHQRGPDAIHVSGGSKNIAFYGVDVLDVGNDHFKLSSVDTIKIIGTVISESDHGNLQKGRGNSNCGWDGDDNYHNDGIQIYPGGVNNLTLEDSYIGRRAVLQVDNGGASNSNIQINRNWFFAEPPFSMCISADMRVKPDANSGAQMNISMKDNQAWCTDSDWTFYVGGSKAGAMTINDDAISADQKNASKYFENKVGTPDIKNSPAYAWRKANPYDSWLADLKE